MQIIPALIADDDNLKNDFEEIKSRLLRIEPFLSELGGWVQLDITDGKFVKTTTYLTWEEIRFITQRAKTDLHLMIQNPETAIDKWIALRPARITFHIEATKKPEEVIAACKQAGIETGIALNPETTMSSVMPYAASVNLFLFLGVNPGKGGQKFIPEVLEKIKSLPQLPANVKIGVDGGVNNEMARMLKGCNVGVLVVGSYLFGSPDIKVAIEAIQ